MIAVERRVIRSFRALLRKCVVGRPRGPAPSVSLQVQDGKFRMWAKTAEAVLVYSTGTPCHDSSIVVPMAMLKTVEGA